MPIVGCKICCNNFYVKPSHQERGWGKYCSIRCRSKGQISGIIVKCHWCKSELYRAARMVSRSKSGNFFCTKSCQTLWRNTIFVGPLSANWKNGGSSYRERLIRSGKIQQCIVCKINNPMVLAAHHKDHNRENNAVDNLTWLCFNCHYLVHHDNELDRKVINELM